MTATALLLPTRAFSLRCWLGLFFGGIAASFAFFAKVAMPEVIDLRFQQLDFFQEKLFSFASSLVLSFPELISPFKFGQLFLGNRHQGER